MWKSIFQACVIMLGSVILFRKDSFNNIVTITFSSLIVCEILNVFSEVYKVNYKMIISSILTFVIYFMSIAMLRSYFDVSYITWVFCCKVIGITLASWAPLHFFKRKLWCVNTDNFQTLVRVFLIPSIQVWNCSLAINTAVSPKINQDHFFADVVADLYWHAICVYKSTRIGDLGSFGIKQ